MSGSTPPPSRVHALSDLAPSVSQTLRSPRVVQRIASEYEQAHFCYEAGPTGYGPASADHLHGPPLYGGGAVADPEETWRRGSRPTAAMRSERPRCCAPGELTAVWMPRSRPRGDAGTSCAHGQPPWSCSGPAVSKSAPSCSNTGVCSPRKRGWTMRYLRWLQDQAFDHPV